MIYATYLGGSAGDDYGYAIAVDALGNAYVAGSTGSPDFPTTPGAFQRNYLCDSGFVTKLNAAGNALVFSTLLGATGGGVCSSTAEGVALDFASNVYVVGETRSTTFPVTANAFQSSNRGGPFYGYDAFLVQLGASGSGLIYSSYLGGSGDDYALSVAVDSTGDAYVTGTTTSVNFPITSFSYQSVIKGTNDAFVAKFPLGAPGGLSLIGIAPNAGGNAGTVSPQIVGNGFHAGATARLNCGPGILGTNTSVGLGGRLLNTTFDLTAVLPGTCSLLVTNPDGTSATLLQAFTVQQGGAPNIQISLTGAARYVTGPETPVPYTNAIVFATVSNIGNVDPPPILVLEPVPPPFSLTSVDPTGLTTLASLTEASDAMWTSALAAGSSQIFTFTATTVSPLSTSSLSSAAFTAATPSSSPPSQFNINGCAMQDFQAQPFDFCIAMDVCALCSFPNPVCQEGAAILEDKACKACNMAATNCANDLPSCGNDTQTCVLDRKAFFTLTSRGGNPSDIINKCQEGDCTSSPVRVVASADPNSLVGPAGVGGQHWISGAQALTYGISFVNEPTATAPAQQVVVTQPLGTDVNLSTLTLPGMTIPNGASNVQVTVPPGSFNPMGGLNEFTTSVDLRPNQSLLVGVDAKLNPATQTLTWTFTSIDPTTGLPTLNPLVGFLPPGAGASVSLSVRPAPSLATGSQVSEQATVVFDANPPMSTAAWINSLDNTPPVSHVSALPATSACPTFRVSWSGSDVGSGLQGFTVFAADNGGPFKPWLSNTTAAAATYTGAVGHMYSFYSISNDLTGNLENGKMSAEASTAVTAAGPCGSPSLSAQVLNIAQSGSTVTASLQLTNTGFTASRPSTLTRSRCAR